MILTSLCISISRKIVEKIQNSKFPREVFGIIDQNWQLKNVVTFIFSGYSGINCVKKMQNGINHFLWHMIFFHPAFNLGMVKTPIQNQFFFLTWQMVSSVICKVNVTFSNGGTEKKENEMDHWVVKLAKLTQF